MKKTVYLFDESGGYLGPYKAQESPLEPGAFIVPTLSTDAPPPALTGGQTAVWNGTIWNVIDPPVIPPHVPTPEELAAAAQEAKDLADAQALKADAKFQNLIAKTSAQCINWAQNSFPTLTAAEQRDLGTLVQAIGILGRRL